MAKNDTEMTMADVLNRLAEIQAKQLERDERDQKKREAREGNKTGPKINYQNLRGEKDFPMAELRFTVNMPFPLRPGGPYLHGLDREEVELMNLLTPGEYEVELNDGSLTTLTLLGKRNHATGELEELTWSGRRDPDTNHPTPFFTHSNKQQFKPLRAMLRQILGDKAKDVMTMPQEMRKIASGELEVSVGA